MIRLQNPSLLNNARSQRAVALQPGPWLSLPLSRPANVATNIVRRGMTLVPPWVFLGMIIVGGAAICSTVNLRASAERRASEAQLNRVSSEIETLRRSNALLQTETQRMNSDPAIIESAARARLGMVRPTDVVVPLAPTSGANLATLSFVR